MDICMCVCMYVYIYARVIVRRKKKHRALVNSFVSCVNRELRGYVYSLLVITSVGLVGSSQLRDFVISNRENRSKEGQVCRCSKEYWHSIVHLQLRIPSVSSAPK